MVNGPGARLSSSAAAGSRPTDVAFADEEELRNAIERILAPLGRRVDELSPMVDARLADGSRVNVVIPPLAIDGPALSIRRFGARAARARTSWSRCGTLTAAQRRLLEAAVGRAAQRPRQRRHRLGQDDPAQRALQLHRRRASGW